MKVFVILLFASFVVFLPTGVPAQFRIPENRKQKENARKTSDRTVRGNAKARPAKRAARSTTTTAAAIAMTADQIKSIDPTIPDDVLEWDGEVVDAALPKVRLKFREEGLNEADAQQATFAAWIRLRIGPGSLDRFVSLTVIIVVDAVSDSGKLVISSEPDGAEIALNGVPSGVTLEKLWLPAGTYKIHLSKPGYHPIQEECQVKARKKTEFRKTLVPR